MLESGRTSGTRPLCIALQTIWEFRLYLRFTPEGISVIWGLDDSKIGEHEANIAIIDANYDLGADGQVFLADESFAGEKFEACIIESLKTHVERPDMED